MRTQGTDMTPEQYLELIKKSREILSGPSLLPGTRELILLKK